MLGRSTLGFSTLWRWRELRAGLAGAGDAALNPAAGGTNLIAGPAILGGLEGMGAKYLPTVKDQKAYQRYRRIENPLHKLNRSAANQAATAEKKAAKSAKKK